MSNSSIQDRYFYDVQEARRRGIDEGVLSCAAGPWNYDMSQAPKDGRDLFILIEYKKGQDIWTDVADWHLDEWRGEGQSYHPDEVIAFAELRLPEAKP